MKHRMNVFTERCDMRPSAAPRPGRQLVRVRNGGVAIVAALILLATTAGCGSSAAPPPATPSSVAAISPYAMRHPNIVENPTGHPDAWYEPNPIRVKVGQSVTWTNRDADPHDATATNGMFASGPIAAGASYTWVPTRPGTYQYFCTIHPEMHGVVIVTR